MDEPFSTEQGRGSKPLLLLDIDGVLNPYAAPACPEGFREEVLFRWEDPVRVGEAHPAWLGELSHAYDVVWATGWGDDAHVLAEILSLPELPVLRMPSVPFNGDEKLAAIQAQVGTRAAAWIDDALPPAAFEWAAGRQAPTLLIGTDPSMGLRREHVDRLLAWAAEFADRRAEE